MKLIFRKAVEEDSKVYFNWANDILVREQSFNKDVILWEDHHKWFLSKINDPLCLMLIFQDENNNNIGQVRFQKEGVNEALIGLSIATEFRGKGYAKTILELSSEYFLSKNPISSINAYIKEQNLSSKFAFEKSGFEFIKMTICENSKSFHYKKRLK